VNRTPVSSQFVGEDWVRMPKPRERLWGLSRTTLLELIQLGEIRSAVIRKPGSIKGIRLIYMPSLSTYLDGCVEEPKPKPPAQRQPLPEDQPVRPIRPGPKQREGETAIEAK
jgi:hypothetical protein